eukprot:SAG11_NODE_543_length_8635_cov_19.964633_4_plen_184_part_00
MECRHDFEDTLHSTIRGTGWMGIVFLLTATVKTYWVWYVALLDTRDIDAREKEAQLKDVATDVNDIIRGGSVKASAAKAEVNNIAESIDKLRDVQIYESTWQKNVGTFLHFVVFVFSASVCVAGFLTQRSVNKDCKISRFASTIPSHATGVLPLLSQLILQLSCRSLRRERPDDAKYGHRAFR